VTCLRRMAGDGPALELGIGTGASHCARRSWLVVDGITFRSDGRPTARQTRATVRSKIVDFADVGVHGATGSSTCVQLLFNSSRRRPGAVFGERAAHLTETGASYRGLRADVPARLDHDQYVHARRSTCGVRRPTPPRRRAQMIEENHVSLSPRGVQFNPVVQRYAWPAELDLMAASPVYGSPSGWELEARAVRGLRADLHVSVYVH